MNAEGTSRDLFLGCCDTPQGRFSTADVKFGFLWFDRVIFDPLADFASDHFYESVFSREPRRSNYSNNKLWNQVADVVVPFHAAAGSEVARELKREMDEKYGDFRRPKDEETDLLRQSFRLSIDHAGGLKDRWGYQRYDHLDQFRAARSGIRTVRQWQALSAAKPVTLLCTDQEEYPIRALSPTLSKVAKARPHNLASILLPDLSQVAWAALVKIRKSRAFGSLRQRITDSVEASDGTPSDAQARFKEVVDAMSDLALERIRPRPWRAWLKGILSNLPVGPINPFSIIDSGLAVRREYKFRKELEWLYLLRDLGRRTATEPTEDFPLGAPEPSSGVPAPIPVERG